MAYGHVKLFISDTDLSLSLHTSDFRWAGLGRCTFVRLPSSLACDGLTVFLSMARSIADEVVWMVEDEGVDPNAQGEEDGVALTANVSLPHGHNNTAARGDLQ